MSSAAAAPTPAAVAAFLRGVERRAAVLAELQCGDAATGDAALAGAMRDFHAQLAGTGDAPPGMAEWPQVFWKALLAQDPLRRHRGAAGVELEATDRLSRLGSGPRAALLLPLAAGLDETQAAAVLGTTGAAYRLATRRALEQVADGREPADAWRQLREHVHRRIKTLPAARQVRLAAAREGAAEAPARPAWDMQAGPGRAWPRWLLPLLWVLLAACALGFAATFWAPARKQLEGPPPGEVWQNEVAASEPASRYGREAALLAHRDFELLADPEVLADADGLAFHAWLAAQGVATPQPGAEPGPERVAEGDAAAAATPGNQGETLHEPR